MSTQQLEEIYRQKSPRRMPKRTAAEQKKLQDFMEKKRRERMKEYRQQLDELREKEAKPFTIGSRKVSSNVSTVKFWEKIQQNPKKLYRSI